MSSSYTKSPSKILHLAIIGSGSAAFSCALKVLEQSDKGQARITIIEADKNIGGCCVNVGCVPSKILIRAAHIAEQQRNNPFDGIENHAPIIDRSQLSAQQHSRVDELRQAKYQKMLDDNPEITLIRGFAQFTDQHTLNITNAAGEQQTLSADKILIATGSTPLIPNIKGLAQSPYWTSTEAIFTTETPKHIVVIGSSVVALEIAQAHRRLGAEVTLIARHTLLYKEEPLLGEQLTDVFEKEGINVLHHTQATEVNHNGSHFFITTHNALKESVQITSDQLVIATGRLANTQALNLESTGINTDQQGFIKVNNKMQSSVEHIYAAGDCSTMPQFVYVAAAAGSRAAINITGGSATLDLTILPSVIFTDPQVATVGLSEEQAALANISTKSRVLTLDNVPRALANFSTDGFIKLVAEKESGRLIGAQILAPEGGELIQSAALAITNKMTVQDLANQLFPYLTMVEGLKLCAQTFYKDVSQLSCCAG